MYRLLLFFCSIPFALGAQQVVKNPSAGRMTDLKVTSVALRSQVDLGPEFFITLSGKATPLPLDPDAPEFTYFLVFNQEMDGSAIELPESPGLEVFFIHSGQTPALPARASRLGADCEPVIDPIPQAVWRAGLPAPSYSRSFSTVTHVVVHHAAGSNTNTNYMQVVRDIYLLHTQVNGWSDVGYNYLVAQNGSIYAGRDPANGAQDNVIGAHFCGANSTTMGICLLGNYETATPTTAAWESLVELVAFKIQKEGLDPFGTYPHSFGSLGAIIGHRNGCSTACPGTHVYSRLSDLRMQVDERITCVQTLDFTSDLSTVDAGATIRFTNRSEGYDSYAWHFEGGEPAQSTSPGEVTVTYPNAGFYSVQLVGFDEDRADTLLRENVIRVKGRPTIFPSPVAAGEVIHIAWDAAISRAELISPAGQVLPLHASGGSQWQVPPAQGGLYMLRVYSAQGVFVAKVLVRME